MPPISRIPEKAYVKCVVCIFRKKRKRLKNNKMESYFFCKKHDREIYSHSGCIYGIKKVSSTMQTSLDNW